MIFFITTVSTHGCVKGFNTGIGLRGLSSSNHSFALRLSPSPPRGDTLAFGEYFVYPASQQ